MCSGASQWTRPACRSYAGELTRLAASWGWASGMAPDAEHSEGGTAAGTGATVEWDAWAALLDGYLAKVAASTNAQLVR